MDKGSKFKLEQMVERYSVEDVLATLAAICQKKTEHLAADYLAQAAAVLGGSHG